jgi:hypothetical protein
VRVKQLKLNRENAFNQLIFEYSAREIQRVYRGYFSRKYRHDFYARKAYIQQVLMQGEQLRGECQRNMEEQIAIAEEEYQQKEAEEFQRLTSGLHHLISTKTSPGIYNSPYLYGNVPTVHDVPLEDHLRMSSKHTVQSQMHGASSRAIRALRDARRTKKAPAATNLVMGPFAVIDEDRLQKMHEKRISVQADSHYDAMREAEKLEKKLTKALRINPEDFITATKKSNPLPKVPTVHIGMTEKTMFRPTQKQKWLAEHNFQSTGKKNLCFDDEGY